MLARLTPATRTLLPLRHGRVPGRATFASAAASLPPAHGAPIAVVGGSGFVGRNIIRLLKESGQTEVVNVDLAPPPGPYAADAPLVRADVTDPSSITAALARQPGEKPFGAVFHVAAYLSFMDRFPSELPKSMAINVGGTKNVIQACRDLNIPYLVQTSTSNVCVGLDICPVIDGDESTPYTEKPVNHYSLSKVEAEKATLAADGASLASGNGTLATVSIRPTSSVIGFLDGLATQAYIKTRTAFPPVKPNSMMDFVHVENVALGHLLALHALRSGAPDVRGRAFFVSNDEPMPYPEYFDLLSSRIPSFRVLNPRMIYPLYALSDAVRRFGGRLPGDVGMLSLAVWQLSNLEYTFSCARAKSALGYKPRLSVAEALDRTMGQYREAGMLA
ncbi:hypothetical protein DFJ74DRAFT_638838 [Hyaloraphidium curvatum]|nr:hypothetical protein DFJ74DRAFT_638838 [Hyaloraphidium curvatum]